MNSKSLVNKSIVKSDIRRYWYLGALFAMALILLTALQVGDYPETVPTGETVSFLASRFSGLTLPSLFPILIFSTLIPAMIFSYLHHKSAVSAMHSIPLSRGALYISHLISVAILILSAIAINSIVLITLCHVPVNFVMIWACLAVVYCFGIASFSAMASMLVGNVVAGIIFPGIIFALPAFIIAISIALCETHLYGYVTPEFVNTLLMHIYLPYDLMLKGWMAMYIALGIIFLILGIIIYKKRALENHSRAMAFSFLNPIFLYSFALCFGFVGYIYVVDWLSMGKSLWIAVPFGIIGVIIAKMIIDKSFKPKGFTIPVIIYCLMMCVVYLFVDADILGYEKRVPHLENIASISINNAYGEYTNSQFDPDTSMNIVIADKAKYDFSIVDKADMEKVLSLHKAIAGNGSRENNDQLNIYLEYTLDNGRRLRRSYSFDSTNELFRLYADVMNIDKVKAMRFPVLRDEKTEYMWANISVMNTSPQSLDTERINQLAKALKADVENASYNDYYRSAALTSVTMGYCSESMYEDGTPVTDKSKWIYDSCIYNIYPGYTNTIALLKQWDLYHKMPSASEISEITIFEITGDSDDIEIDSVEYVDSVEYSHTEKSSVEIDADEPECITDKDKIAKILDFLKNNEPKLSESGGDFKGYRIEISFENGSWWSVYTKENVLQLN